MAKRRFQMDTMTRSIGVSFLLSAIIFLNGCAGLRVDRTLRPAEHDWLTYGGGPTRVNTSISIVEPPLEPIWEYNANAGIAGSPLVRDSVLVLGTLNGELQAVNIVTGKRIGYAVLTSAVAGTPAWDGSMVIVPVVSSTESVVALGLRRAEKKWSVSLGPVESSPLLFEEYVYVTSLEGALHCLRKIDGSEVWKFVTRPKEKRKPVRSSPATDGEIVVFGGDDGFLYAVNRREGTLRWKAQTDGSIFGTPIIASGLVIIGSMDGHLYAIDAKEGTVQWKFSTGSNIYGSASANDSLVFVGSADGICRAVDLRTGSERWKYATRSVLNSAPLVAGKLIYIGSLDRTLYALTANTGAEVWKFDAPGRIRVSPVIWGNLLLVTSEDKFITALKPSKSP